MARHRLLAPAVLALTAIAVTPAAADSGFSRLDVTTVCNTTTGEYLITFEIVNSTNFEGYISVSSFEVDGVDQPLTFSPEPVGVAPSSATATASVPGETTSILLDLVVSYSEFVDFHDYETTLAGDCDPAVSATTATTLPPTTAPVTSPSPSERVAAPQQPPPAEPVAVSPRFTG